MEINKYENGFGAGWCQIRKCDETSVRKKLLRALGVSNLTSFHLYKNGTYEFRVSQIVAIESIFASYGITNVWGKPFEND